MFRFYPKFIRFTFALMFKKCVEITKKNKILKV